MIDIDSLTPEQKEMAKTIGDAAVEAGIDPDLAIAQAFTESRLNHFVGEGKGRHVIKSDQDAYGVMQITPELAKAYGYTKQDLLNPLKNIKAYTDIMSNYMTKYGAPDLAVMAYHQGEGPVDKFLKTNDTSHIGPNGKQYVLSIGEHYDFNRPEEMTEAEKIAESGGIPPMEPEKPKEESVVPEWARPAMDFVAEHPTMASIGASPFTYKAQKSMNKEARRDMRSQEQARQNASLLEEQFKLQQAQMQGEPTSGDKWSTKSVGSLGPGGESTAEAARNYRIQKRLQVAPDVQNPNWQAGRSGIILPRGMQEQIDKAMLEQSPVQRAINAANTSKRLISGGLSRVGQSPLMTGAGTAMAGVYADQASEREQAGDELGAAISRIKALTAGVAGIPIPPRYRPAMIVKGVGGLGTVGLEALDEWRMRNFPPKSVVKP